MVYIRNKYYYLDIFFDTMEKESKNENQEGKKLSQVLEKQ
jgi:hypothetical protein